MKPTTSSFLQGCLAAAVVFLGSASHAGTPLGGLTVALSPDESTLVASGDPRTLYIIDAASLEVKDRIWVETSVVDMAFSKDGGTLAVFDTADDVRLYSTSDWSLKTTVEKCANFTTSREGDIFAGFSSSDYKVKIVSLSDGAEKSSISLPDKTRLSGLGLSADGAKLAIVYSDQDDESEEKVAYSDIPKDLKGLEKDRYTFEHDGKTSKFAIHDVASGEVKSEFTSFYTSTSVSSVGFAGEKIVVINYRNLNAFITPEGEVEMFSLPSSFNYGMAFSPDQSLIMGGSLAHGSVMKVADQSTFEFRIDKLPGWPEYFKGFCAASDGTVYGATSGYRVIKVGPGGDVQEQKPVH